MTGLATLDLAIEWVQERWHNQRSVPLRLHTRDEEGTGLMKDRAGCKCLACNEGPSEASLGSHAHSRAFEVALDGSPNQVVTATRTATCWHPLLPKHLSPRDCPECQGHGLKDVRSDLFAFPMSRALANLANSLGSRKHPHPYALVLILASHGWLPQQAARSMDIPWDRAEPLFLMALRKLHNFYAEGPVSSRSSVGWVTMSESNRAAILDGETAA